jgi:hypothetical protein
MAARQDDKDFEIADLGFRIADLKKAGRRQKTDGGRRRAFCQLSVARLI